VQQSLLPAAQQVGLLQHAGVAARLHVCTHATPVQLACTCWLMGVAKVESMTTMAPLGSHSALTRGMSTQRRQGLVGDSEKNRDT
jgi:hypothetical protein